MQKWEKLPSSKILDTTVKNLNKNGINSLVVKNKSEALKIVKELIPEGAEVMTMSSVTLQETGIKEEINESGKYDSVKTKLSKMDRETQSSQMQKIGAAPTWSIGSVQAVTQDGHVFIASNSGSQLPAYVYASEHVIWIVGTQKIVKDDEAALKRIYKYILPKESVRLGEQYGDKNLKSNVSKIVIINKEMKPDRIKLIFIKERLGF